MYSCENTTEKGQWTRYKTWNKQTESEAWGSGYVILSKISDRDKKQNGGKIEVDCQWRAFVLKLQKVSPLLLENIKGIKRAYLGQAN